MTLTEAWTGFARTRNWRVVAALTFVIAGCKSQPSSTGPDLPLWDFSGAVEDAGPDLWAPSDLTVIVRDLAGADLAPRPDLAVPTDMSKTADMTRPVDLARRNDLASAPDLAPTTCTIGADCRLFSSTCDTAPCECIALLNAALDPPCTGGMVTCLQDPCNNFNAVCVAGQCVVR